MKILHYVMGLPPVVSGGLVRYALDLAQAQKNMGHQTAMLVPGESRKHPEDVHIRVGTYESLSCFYIINALPVAMGKGLQQPELLYKSVDGRAFHVFLKKWKPDVVHIHSFMGLHKEFLEAAKQLNIKILFTTHDYGPLCPRNTLFCDGACCDGADWSRCGACLGQPVSIKQINAARNRRKAWIRRSMLYRWAEYAPLLRPIKRLVYSRTINTDTVQRDPLTGERICVVTPGREAVSSVHNAAYLPLQDYYHSMLRYVDFFHCNSKQAEAVYEHFLGHLPGMVLPISNREIGDKRKKKKYAQHATLHIGYLATKNEEKGFGLLMRALHAIWQEGYRQFELEVFFNYYGTETYVKQSKPYSREQVDEVFARMDLVVVPSICKETYGMVALEALCHGVPVIVTENVGAKELIEKHPGWGFVVKPSVESVRSTLKQLVQNRDILQNMNRKICTADWELAFDRHVEAIMEVTANLAGDI